MTNGITARQQKIDDLRARNEELAQQTAELQQQRQQAIQERNFDREKRIRERIRRIRSEARRNRASIRASNRIIDKLKRQQEDEIKKQAQAAGMPGARTAAEAAEARDRPTGPGLVVGTEKIVRDPVTRRLTPESQITREARATVTVRSPQPLAGSAGQRPAGPTPVLTPTMERIGAPEPPTRTRNEPFVFRGRDIQPTPTPPLAARIERSGTQRGRGAAAVAGFAAQGVRTGQGLFTALTDPIGTLKGVPGTIIDAPRATGERLSTIRRGGAGADVAIGRTAFDVTAVTGTAGASGRISQTAARRAPTSVVSRQLVGRTRISRTGAPVTLETTQGVSVVQVGGRTIVVRTQGTGIAAEGTTNPTARFTALEQTAQRVTRTGRPRGRSVTRQSQVGEIIRPDPTIPRTTRTRGEIITRGQPTRRFSEISQAQTDDFFVGGGAARSNIRSAPREVTGGAGRRLLSREGTEVFEVRTGTFQGQQADLLLEQLGMSAPKPRGVVRDALRTAETPRGPSIGGIRGRRAQQAVGGTTSPLTISLQEQQAAGLARDVAVAEARATGQRVGASAATARPEAPSRAAPAPSITTNLRELRRSGLNIVDPSTRTIGIPRPPDPTRPSVGTSFTPVVELEPTRTPITSPRQGTGAGTTPRTSPRSGSRTRPRQTPTPITIPITTPTAPPRISTAQTPVSTPRLTPAVTPPTRPGRPTPFFPPPTTPLALPVTRPGRTTSVFNPPPRRRRERETLFTPTVVGLFTGARTRTRRAGPFTGFEVRGI